MIKRIFDFVFSLLLIVVFSPLLVLLALLVLIFDGWPILFFQERYGKNKKIFIIYKFRTMREGFEKDNKLIKNNFNDGRVTSLGAFLRTLNLDELPQLFNIFLGKMSFVGPRPDPIYISNEIKKEIKNWDERLEVKPGLTGLAQINNESSLRPKPKLTYDLKYIKNRGFFTDMLIIARTFIWIINKGSK